MLRPGFKIWLAGFLAGALTGTAITFVAFAFDVRLVGV
jgi:hypothetical protein